MTPPVGGRSSGKQPTSLGRGGALARRGARATIHFVRTKSARGRRRLSSRRDARPRSLAMDAAVIANDVPARKTRYAEIYGALADGIRSGRYRSAAGCRPRRAVRRLSRQPATRCARRSAACPTRAWSPASPASAALCCGARAPAASPSASRAADLLAYVKTAQLEILEARDVKAGAAERGCSSAGAARPGTGWWR